MMHSLCEKLGTVVPESCLCLCAFPFGMVLHVQESVEAYREVNVFLTKEVSELYELRSADQHRISALKE